MSFIKRNWQFIFGLIGLVTGLVSIKPVLFPEPDLQPSRCEIIAGTMDQLRTEYETRATVVSALDGRLIAKDKAFKNAQRERDRLIRVLEAHELREHVIKLANTLKSVDLEFREKFSGSSRIYDTGDAEQTQFYAESLSRVAFPNRQERRLLINKMERLGFNISSLGPLLSPIVFIGDETTIVYNEWKNAARMAIPDEQKLWDLGYDLDVLRDSADDRIDSLRSSMDAIKADYRLISTKHLEENALLQDIANRLQEKESEMVAESCN